MGSDILGNKVTITYFVDVSHGSNLLNRCLHTGILLFLNRAPIHWYSKSQRTAESSTFGSEFIALKTAVEMIIVFRFKLRCFDVSIDWPTNVLCDNETVCNNTRSPDSRLNKKHNAIAFHKSREAVAASIIRIAHESSTTNISDFLTKQKSAKERDRLLFKFTYWKIKIQQHPPQRGSRLHGFPCFA